MIVWLVMKFNKINQTVGVHGAYEHATFAREIADSKNRADDGHRYTITGRFVVRGEAWEKTTTKALTTATSSS